METTKEEHINHEPSEIESVEARIAELEEFSKKGTNNESYHTVELARWYDNNLRENKITVSDYLTLLKKKDKANIADFIYHRLHSRYIKPFLLDDCQYKEEYKNGFSIMANCCLLIETLQSFKNGWEDSNRKSELAFKQFLSTEANFSIFKNRERAFYTNVRCGILHQGETTGGWRINRKGKNLFDIENLAVDSVTFVKQLENSLKEYLANLKASEWDSEIWDNFRIKMRKIIANCQK